MSLIERRVLRIGIIAPFALVVASAAAAGLALSFVVGGSESGKAGIRWSNVHAGHLNPHPAAGSFKPDDTKLDDCHVQGCYEQAFGDIAYDEGPKAALTLFDQKMKTDAAIEAGCHRIAHMIGSAALARYHGDVTRAFAEGSSSCWSGYYHGILEHALASAQTRAQYAAVARRICSGSAIRKTTWLAYQCVHGLGHGLMLQSGYDLPFALRICDKLETHWDQISCTGGVFMENINAANGSAYGLKTRWLKRNDLVYPCDAVSSKHKLYCYLMVTSRILPANGYDWKATARICDRVEQGWVSTCFQSYGRDADGSTRQDPAKVLSLCRLTGAHQADCLYGAARDMTANYSSGVRAAELCNRAPVTLRTRCFYGIGTIVGGFSSSSAKVASDCREVTRRYLQACLRGTGA
jgi:hypothetical protein